MERMLEHFSRHIAKRPGEYVHMFFGSMLSSPHKTYGTFIYAPPGVNIEERERDRRERYEKRRAQWDNDNQAKRGQA